MGFKYKIELWNLTELPPRHALYKYAPLRYVHDRIYLYESMPCSLASFFVLHIVVCYWIPDVIMIENILDSVKYTERKK